MRQGKAQQDQRLMSSSATFRDRLSFKSNQQAFYKCLFRVKDFMKIPFCFFLPEALRRMGYSLCFFFYSLRTIACPSAVCSPGEGSLLLQKRRATTEYPWLCREQASIWVNLLFLAQNSTRSLKYDLFAYLLCLAHLRHGLIVICFPELLLVGSSNEDCVGRYFLHRDKVLIQRVWCLLLLE